MKKIILLLLLVPFYMYGQVDKTYYNLEEALANPALVYKLNLSGQDIGSLPESIGGLQNLEYLILKYNYLINLPEGIVQL